MTLQSAVPLALGFANLPLLYALGAASLPVILHLLNRKKYREIPWAAMRFLRAAAKKNSRRIRLEQWILLAVRTMLVIAVVLAMAKPFLESLGALPTLAGQRTHRVLVIDGSLSMAFAPDKTSRFDRAKSVATQLVKDARRGDTFSLVLLGAPPRVVVGSPSPNPAEVLKELDEVAQTHGSVDLVAGFDAIVRALAASEIPQKEVIFLTDLQLTSWGKPGSAADAGLKRAVATLASRKARSVVIDLGQADGENRAVVDLRLDTPIVTPGSATPITASLRNLGPTARPGTKVRLAIDGQLGPEQVVDLPANEDVPVVFIQAFDAPGEHLVEARIEEDELAVDDRRSLAVSVREHLDVLLVDGDPKSEPFQAETDYLARAISPPSDSGGAASPVRVEVVGESQLAGRDLSTYDAVVLCNVAQVSAAEESALDAYLKQGGGLVVFGGDQVVADNYNRLLHADGKGILPAAIGPSVGDAGKKSGAPLGLNPLGFKHPIVAAFAGESDAVRAGLTGAKTWQFHKLTLPADAAGAAVALAFENGDPAVIEAPRHRGKVIQVATSADAGWSTWALHQSYPPVMEQIILQAASGRSSTRNVRVGQPLDQALPASGAAASVAVTRPDGKAVPARMAASGDVSRFHFEETDLSGPYRVQFGAPLAREALFAADADPGESDPAKLDRVGLAEAIPGWEFAYRTDWRNLAVNATSVGRRGELHRPLLLAVLALLMIESVLAWYFGHHRSG